MIYKVLSQEEQDDILVATFLAQERDHFCHTVNLDRYTEMLKDPTLSAPFRARIVELRDGAEKAQAEVASILSKTEPQLPDQAAIDAAVVRLKAKEAAALAKG